MTALRLLPVEAGGYQRHPMHRSERIWNETNCYVDLWVEVLHALELEPLAAASFALVTDFEGDQWTFFKFPPEDLREVFGVRVYEANVWRGVLEHVSEHLDAGRLATVEVDSFYLPDTAGVSYGVTHGKTTIVPNLIDPESRRLGYFHNASYYELEGDDFDGVFRLGGDWPDEVLVPYLETIRLDLIERITPQETTERAERVLRHHLDALPAANPVARFAERLEDDLSWLRSAGVEGFHLWAFGAIRQFGASAEVASEHLSWLDESTGEAQHVDAVRELVGLAEGAKALQFQLARAARGRAVELGPSIERLSVGWDAMRDALRAHAAE